MSNAPRSWHALRFIVKPEAVEAVEFAFNSLDALGIEVDLMPTLSAGVCVSGYFDELPDDLTMENELQYSLQIHDLAKSAILSLERCTIQETDWLAEWKKHWKPTSIDRFIIAAPWHEIDEPDKFVIRIEPNMAFGTGTHATTQLCLEAIGKHFHADNSFLDVGTGTGILAIAAAKLAGETIGGNTSSSECAPSILVIDNDPDSIIIARENAESNGVGTQIDSKVAEISADTEHFDFVCANLTLDVILPILPLLIAKAKRTLVLSGILSEQESEIVNALADNGFENPTIAYSGEWIAVTILKG